MYKWSNFNEILRNKLTKLYKQIDDVSDTNKESLEKYKMFILNLKENDYNLYKNIIGLAFNDSYLMLKYKDLYNQLSESEEATLTQFESINDIDELLIIIDEEPNILNAFLSQTLLFNKLTKISKAYRLLIADESFLNRFSILTLIEKECLFQSITIDELVNDYKSYIEENKFDAFSNEALETEANSRFFDEILIRSYGNIDNFQELILNMLKPVYKWKKKSSKNSLYFCDIDDELITLVENESIKGIVNKFINDGEFLNYLVEEYIYYINKNLNDYEDELDQFFDKKISQDTKIKIKEM